MQWFVGHTIRNDADKEDPRLNIVGKANLAGLPPHDGPLAGPRYPIQALESGREQSIRIGKPELGLLGRSYPVCLLGAGHPPGTMARSRAPGIPSKRPKAAASTAFELGNRGPRLSGPTARGCGRRQYCAVLKLLGACWIT